MDAAGVDFLGNTHLPHIGFATVHVYPGTLLRLLSTTWTLLCPAMQKQADLLWLPTQMLAPSSAHLAYSSSNFYCFACGFDACG